MINLLPAILLAGPPHSGKSVLAHLLTQELVRCGLAHYLLRAVPDGEGNWFYTGSLQWVRTMRMDLKHGYTDAFIDHMTSVVEHRAAPLLVDIGGLPRGKQFDILRACTHLVLLYRSPEEHQLWLRNLAEEQVQLITIAELCSNQAGLDMVDTTYPWLQGRISGLERDLSVRGTGPSFSALADLVKRICKYDEIDLKRIHLRHAPFLVIEEQVMARQAGIAFAGKPFAWQPEHLPLLQDYLPLGTPCSLYGRGPVWLAAFAAARSAPAGFAIFDLRYGWIRAGRLARGGSAKLVQTEPWQGRTRLKFNLEQGFLEPDELALPALRRKSGVLLDGALPRWAFAQLAYNFALKGQEWIGVRDARLNSAICVYSRIPDAPVGETIALDDTG